MIGSRLTRTVCVQREPRPVRYSRPMRVTSRKRLEGGSWAGRFSSDMSGMIFILVISEESVEWWNYPGLELWKFLNLFLFLAVLVYFLRRPLSEAFRGRREAIRQELLRAQQERDAAIKKLQEVEAKLERLDVEILAIKERASKE